MVPWSSPTGFLKDVCVEALLRGHLCRVVVGADPELEVAHMVGRQLHPDLDGLATLVLPHQHTSAVHPSRLIGTGLQIKKIESKVLSGIDEMRHILLAPTELEGTAYLFGVPRVTADSTLAAVDPPLSGEPAAVKLVVVVIWFGLEPIPAIEYSNSRRLINFHLRLIVNSFNFPNLAWQMPKSE